MTVQNEGPESDSVPTRAERDQIVDRLQEAVGDGALTLDEFQERLDAAYTAGTRAKLQSLVGDLPSPRPATTPGRSAFRNRWVLGVAAIAVGVVIATGLAIGLSQRSSRPPSPKASAVRDVDSCMLLNSAQVDAVLGAVSVSPPSRSGSDRYGWDECSYITASSSGPAVDVQAGTAISGFAARYKTTNSHIAGIGDQAALYTNLPGAAVLARRGSKWVDVYVEYLPPGVATLDAEGLAKDALHQLTTH